MNENEIEIPQASPSSSSSLHVAIGLAVACLVLVAFRLHAFDLPLETDECNYAYIGARLLEGESLYEDVWDHQPFGVFALFGAVIAVFGDSPLVFRCMALAFSLASLVLLFEILRREFGLLAAVCGGLMFAVASSDPGTAGEGCNREIYMNTFVLAAWFLFLFRKTRPALSLLGAGSALAVGSAIKTIIAIPWLFALVFLIAEVLLDRSSANKVRRSIKTVLLFSTGPAVLWVGAFIYYAATSRVEAFIDAVFLFNLSYAGSADQTFRFIEFFTPDKHPFIFHSALPLWVFGALAVVCLALQSFKDPQRRILLVLTMVIACYVAVCLPAQFWPHYYYLLIPPLICAVAALAHQVACTIARVAPRKKSLVLIIFVLAPALLAFSEHRSYLDQPLFGITRNRYNSRDFWGRAIGEKIRSVTNEDDTIFVYGSDTAVYYYSDRRCASRYTMITGISSAYAGHDERREIMLEELKDNPPRLIVLLFDEAPFDQWVRFLHENYGDPVGFDFHDSEGREREAIMLVLTNKNNPIEPTAQDYWNWHREEVGGW